MFSIYFCQFQAKEKPKQFSSVQSLSRVQLFVTPWTAARQASLSITNSRSLLKLMSIELVMSSNHLNLCWPFSSCLQSFPASGFFPISRFFPSRGQSIGVSASTSVLPVNVQDWFPLRWTGWISLQSKEILRVPNIDFIIFILQFYFLGTQFQSLFSLCTAHTYSSCFIHIHSHCQVHT